MNQGHGGGVTAYELPSEKGLESKKLRRAVCPPTPVGVKTACWQLSHLPWFKGGSPNSSDHRSFSWDILAPADGAVLQGVRALARTS